MDDKQQSLWIPSSEGLRDCIRLQLARNDLIEVVLLLARPRLLQKHVDEFINGSSLRHGGNTTSEKRKSDGGKELDCNDDIYRVIHWLI